jgi:hypothetical protein
MKQKFNLTPKSREMLLPEIEEALKKCPTISTVSGFLHIAAERLVEDIKNGKFSSHETANPSQFNISKSGMLRCLDFLEDRYGTATLEKTFYELYYLPRISKKRLNLAPYRRIIMALKEKNTRIVFQQGSLNLRTALKLSWICNRIVDNPTIYKTKPSKSGTELEEELQELAAQAMERYNQEILP